MGGATGRIFLSYRREDTRHMAGRLADRLNLRFGPGTVFMDVDAIEPGADFRRSIAEAVSSCDLLIALIGPNWLVLDQQTRMPRIYEYDDFVAIEIKAALDRGIRVIPVLVDEAKMPTSAQLPASIRPLATRNATRVDHETFPSDVERLLGAVERILRAAAMERTAPTLPRQQSPLVQAPIHPDPTEGHPKTTPAMSDRQRPPPERQQAPPGQPALGFIGAPGTDTSPREDPPPPPDPRIPPVRAAARIALWWVIYIISMFTAVALFQVILGRTTSVSSSIAATIFLLGVIGGLTLLLRGEIRAQQRTLRQSGPDGEARLSNSAVSARHIRKVAVICAVVALGFGLVIVSAPPTTTASNTGTSTTVP
jgi:hypothetical protein